MNISAQHADAYRIACESVDVTIAPDDEMRSSWNLTEQVYLYGGRTALKISQQAMLMAGKQTIGRILDFPCGHGRALRYFRAGYPDAEIFAGDINESGVAFCEKQFGAIPFPAFVDIGKTDLPKNMDIIWCGSLLTHLDEDRSKLLISKFLDALAPEGICLFTTHGRFYPRYVQVETPIMERGLWDNIVRDYYRKGYGYHVYPGFEAQQYGLSLISPGWIFDQLHDRDDVTVLFHAEKAWHGQHNVTAVIKRHLYSWFDPASI
jgi:SAM-dependent methyltransferase